MVEIIVIDDDQEILNLFRVHFKSELNTRITYVNSYLEGLAVLANRKFDLYIIDYQLDHGFGLKLIGVLQKEEHIDNRVLLMSGRISVSKRIEAFNLGVSNIVDKPINFKILRAVINKNIRMILSHKKEVIQEGNLEINVGTFECFETIDKVKTLVPLTLTEFKVLKKLVENKGRVISKMDLSFLGGDPNNPMGFKSLEMKIVSIRKKLHHCARELKTVRGVGYRYG